MHTSTKFRGIWICTLGDMLISLKGTKSVRKVTNVGLIKSHLDWKVLKLETCLQVFEVPKFGSEMIYKHDNKRVQGHLIMECTLHMFDTQDEDQDLTQVEDIV